MARKLHQMKTTKKRWLEKQKNSSKLQRQRERKTERERVFVGMQYCSRKQVDKYGMYESNLLCLTFLPSAGVREQKKSTQRKRKREQFNDEVPIITFSIQRLKLAHIHTHTHTQTAVWSSGVFTVVQGHRDCTICSVLSNTVARWERALLNKSHLKSKPWKSDLI